MGLRVPLETVDVTFLLAAGDGAEGALLASAGCEGTSAAIGSGAGASVVTCPSLGSIGASSEFGSGRGGAGSDGATAGATDASVGVVPVAPSTAR
jgi:hypothetical protein